jgi:trimethylamine-N-oxide reductase (cytochrome c)
MLQEAIMNPPLAYWGCGAFMTPVEDQFKKYTYPIPEQEGGTEVHLIWTDTPCRTTCWNDGHRTVEAMRNPKIECIIAQHPWLENDCLIADIVLPSNTTLEVDDIVTNIRQSSEYPNVTLQRQAIGPVGESMSDFEVVVRIAGALGKAEQVTGGRTIAELQKMVYDGMEFNNIVGWDEFSEKDYFVFPTAPDWQDDPPGLYEFYQDPERHPLPTPSGKLEFYSRRLARHFPDDTERPPAPQWVEKSITHDERLSSERAEKYPLLVISNHGRWRVHSQCDDISWTREAPTCKVRGRDGYLYEPLWLNPVDAAARVIGDGDIVKIHNERGIVLAGAYVTERIMPGVVYIDHGARYDPILPGKIDRGGAINLISPIKTTSKNCIGMATSGYLVEVTRLDMTEMEAWMSSYPDAFARDYDPASGPRFDAWVEGGL